MKRHIVCGRYSSGDTTTIPKRADEELIQLNLIDSNGKLNYGMGRALDELIKYGIFPTETGIDLFVFAAHVQVADTRISRVTDSQDSWSREIRLVVPVSDPAKWQSASSTITKLLNFLTGDYWTINFRLRPTNFSHIVPEGSELLTGIPYDHISLFSGGLDSLIGAIDLLENGAKPLLISHASESSVSDAQKDCYDALKSYYAKSTVDRLRVWMNFPDVKVTGNENEKTTRGRSFLFFTIGVFAGTGFQNAFTLRVPENGLIALNIPLDPLRLGSHSTRTTHPFYIARWNELLGILQINGRIENPYWDKTKGEMVGACANKKLLQQLISGSLSCSSPSKERWRGLGVQHCGYCLPCLIRRSALEKGLGKGADKSIYTVDNLQGDTLDSMKAEGKQIRSFQVAIRRLNTKPGIEKFLIHTTGSLSDVSTENKKALADLYVRGMNEIASFLKGVRTKPKQNGNK